MTKIKRDSFNHIEYINYNIKFSGGIIMNVELNRDEILYILDGLYEKYLSTKAYFAEHPKEDDVIGMTTPEELKAAYNGFLSKVQKQGEYKFLDLIK